jgi:RimJ/RimL family protein N-acetyltransferase
MFCAPVVWACPRFVRSVAEVTTTLDTDRLVLRALQPDDLDDLARLHAEPSFWEYPLGRGQTYDETVAFLHRVLDDYDGRGFGLEAVVDHQSRALAGWAGLSVPTFLPETLRTRLLVVNCAGALAHCTSWAAGRRFYPADALEST